MVGGWPLWPPRVTQFIPWYVNGPVFGLAWLNYCRNMAATRVWVRVRVRTCSLMWADWFTHVLKNDKKQVWASKLLSCLWFWLVKPLSCLLGFEHAPPFTPDASFFGSFCFKLHLSCWLTNSVPINWCHLCESGCLWNKSSDHPEGKFCAEPRW